MSTPDASTPETSVLEIKDLHVDVANTDENAEPINILKGVNLTVRSGETHAIMGPTVPASRRCRTPSRVTPSTRSPRGPSPSTVRTSSR